MVQIGSLKNPGEPEATYGSVSKVSRYLRHRVTLTRPAVASLGLRHRVTLTEGGCGRVPQCHNRGLWGVVETPTGSGNRA